MKVTLQREFGLIPARQTVELEVDSLPTALARLLQARRNEKRRSGTLTEQADASTVWIRLDNQPSVEIDESTCTPEELEALDKLWAQAARGQRFLG